MIPETKELINNIFKKKFNQTFKQLIIDFKDVQIAGRIGKGGFGEVFKGSLNN